jgi:hypothetical protein
MDRYPRSIKMRRCHQERLLWQLFHIGKRITPGQQSNDKLVGYLRCYPYRKSSCSSYCCQSHWTVSRELPRVFGKFLAAAFNAALKPYVLDGLIRRKWSIPAQLPMPVRHMKKAKRNDDASRSSLTYARFRP